MAITAKTSGNVTISEAGAVPLILSPISSETPTVTNQVQGIKIQAANTTASLSLGGVTNAVLVHLKFTDNSTGDAKETNVKINGAAAFEPGGIEWLYVGDDTSAGITSLSIQTLGGNSTKIEFTIAGV